MADGPSAHLKWHELQCNDGTPYPDKWRNTRAVELALAFEDIRAIWGKPIRVTSGYRTEEYNQRVGGAKYSQHVQGRALDLLPPEGVSVNEFFIKIRFNALFFGVIGIGVYRTHVHIDVRPSDKITVWDERE